MCFDLAEERVPYHILLETTIRRMIPQVAIHLHLVHMFLQGKNHYMCVRIPMFNVLTLQYLHKSIILIHAIFDRSTGYSATQNHPFRSRFLRSIEFDSSDKEDNNLSKDIQGTKNTTINSSPDATKVEDKANNDNPAKR